MKKLKILNLDDNHEIENDQINGLTNLEQLNLKSNGKSTDIHNLVNLRKLNLSHNNKIEND